MGTVPYMSPEQVSGEPVDHRTDVFSLGVAALRDGERASPVQRRIRRRSSPRRSCGTRRRPWRPCVPACRTGLMQVVSRCLEKEPAARFRSMRDVHDALQALPRDGSDRPTAPGRRQRPRSRALLHRGRRRDPAGGGGVSSRAPESAVGGRRGPATGPEIRSIAVLPLDNYSGDPSQDYFAEGMTDELTADLARISQLRVISRGSAMQFRGSNRPSTPEIAKAARRRRHRGGLGAALRRQGPDHRAADRRAGGPAPVGQELRAQLEGRARAAGRAGVGHRPRDQRAADPGRAVAPRAAHRP